MTISIGGRPISKWFAGLFAAVGSGVVIAVTDASASWLTMGRDGWTALIITTAAPIIGTYFKKLNAKDVHQIVDAAPEQIAAEANLAIKHKSPY